MRSTQLVWIDLETTGIEPATSAITEVAAIVTTPELEILGAPQRWLVMPTGRYQLGDWAREHTEYGRVSRDIWRSRGAVSIYEIAQGLRDLLDGRRVAGQGVGFDLAHLAAHGVRRRHTGDRRHDTPLDLQQLAWPLWASGRIESLGLASICAALGVELQGHHDALVDITATLECARRIVARWR